MSRTRQIISCFLALCLAAAGAVGLNPTLHHWLEHGGHGPAHTHAGGIAHTGAPHPADAHRHTIDDFPAHNHGHAHDADPGHRHATDTSERSPLDPVRGLWAHSHGSFASPADSLARLWKALTCWLNDSGQTNSQPTPADSTPDHQHHSLAQSLVGGLVEHTADVPLLRFEFELEPLPPLPAETILLAKGFDAQSASRGPPSQRS